jgi:hypothetical protein
VQLTPGRFSPVEQGLPGKPSGVDPPSAIGAPATMVAVEKRIAVKDRRSFIFALRNVVFGKSGYWREAGVFAVLWERVIVWVFILLSLPSVSAFWSESRKASV